MSTNISTTSISTTSISTTTGRTTTGPKRASCRRCGAGPTNGAIFAVLVATALIVNVLGVGDARSEPLDGGSTDTTAPAATTATTAPTVTTTTPRHGQGGETGDTGIDPESTRWTGPPPTAPDGSAAPMSEGPIDEPPPAEDPTGRVRMLMADLSLAGARGRVDDASAAVAQAQEGLEAADGRVTIDEAGVSNARVALDVARGDLAAYGAWAYMYGGGGVIEADLRGDTTATARKQQFLASSIEHRDDVVEKAREALTTASARHDDSLRGLDQAEALLGEANAVLETARVDLADAGRERASAARALRPGDDRWQLTIEGTSVLAPEELSGWFEARGRRSQAGEPIDQVARYYVEEGDAEGIRGDVAFAQAILETGSFGNRDTIEHNNYAGIGHCSDCPSGFHFGSVQLGVRAQMQLLRSYADPSVEHANPLVDRRLVGPAGCCQGWKDLAGVWAGDAYYGERILAIYQDMLEWVSAARAARR